MAFNVSNVKLLTDEEHRIVMDSVDKLSIVFDDVRYAKRYDRYIVVNSDKQFGVVDLQGNVVIPIEYNKITTTNPAIFRVFGDYDQSRIGSFGSLCRYEAAFDYDGRQLFPFTSFTKIILIGGNGFIFGNEFPSQDAVSNVMPNTNSPMYLVNHEAKCLRVPKEYGYAIASKYVPSIAVLVKRTANENRVDSSKVVHIAKGVDIVDLVSVVDKILPLQEFIDTVAEEYANEVKKKQRWNVKVDAMERLMEMVTVVRTTFNYNECKALFIDKHWIVTDSNFNVVSFLLLNNDAKTIYNS